MRCERACGGQPCLRLQDTCFVMAPVNLQMQTTKTSRATSNVLQSACSIMEEHHTWNARILLPEFCEGLSVGENITIWVSNEEIEDNFKEEHVVANIKEKAIHLEKANTYCALQFKRMIECLYSGIHLSQQ